MPEIKRPKYKKPEIKELKGKVIGRKKQTIVYGKARKTYVRPNFPQEGLDLLKEAKAAGIPVEEPFSYTLKKSDENGKGPMAFLSAGIPVSVLLLRLLPKKRTESVLNQMINIVAGLQNLGISHGHPNLGNFVIERDKLTIIGFEFATKVQVNWSNYMSVFDGFMFDFAHLKDTLYTRFKFDDYQVENFFSVLIAKYTDLPKDQRKNLLRAIMKLDHVLLLYGRSPRNI